MTVATPHALATVPVFPLPRIVLFPGTQLPLHMFEHRYRRLTHDCLDRADPLMVVVQLQPGFEADYAGRPPIQPVGGLGRIIQDKRNPDGTYDILLEALSRVALNELPAEGLPYRRAHTTPLFDRLPSEGLVASEVAAMLSLAGRITGILKEAQPDFDLDLDPDDEPGAVADHIADQLVLAPNGRQAILECLDVGARIRMVMEQLARLHAALSAHHGRAETLH